MQSWNVGFAEKAQIIFSVFLNLKRMISAHGHATIFFGKNEALFALPNT